MKLKNLSVVTLLLSSMWLISCTASGTVVTNPSPTPTAAATATPVPGVQTVFSGVFSGANETPPVSTGATGSVSLTLNADQVSASLTVNFQGLSSDQVGAHIHGPAAIGISAPVMIPLQNGQINNLVLNLTADQVVALKAGKLYVNIHTTLHPDGEIRAQLEMK
jgi:hypothetical protein